MVSLLPGLRSVAAVARPGINHDECDSFHAIFLDPKIDRPNSVEFDILTPQTLLSALFLHCSFLMVYKSNLLIKWTETMRLQQIPLKIDFFIYSTSILQNFFVCHFKDINSYKSFEIIQGQHLRFLMFEDKTTKRIWDFFI